MAPQALGAGASDIATALKREREPSVLPRGLLPALSLVTLLVLAPLAEAHLAGARPILQRAQFQRLPDIQPNGTELRVDLILQGPTLSDPLRHLVRHFMDPSRGRFAMDHAEDGSRSDDRFHAQWRFQRLIEFRDANVNGRFEDATDTVVRSWRFEHYEWRRDDIQRVLLEDVHGYSAIWSGNLTGGPTLRMQIAFAGRDFTDEGAIVRPQDVILYFDVTNMPERSIGSLYALEIDVTARADTVLGFHRVNATPTALLADAPLRRAFLVWGGEGFLDGREQRLDASIVDDAIVEGERKARLLLHMPTVDRSMRFVMVTGIEYGIDSPRSGTPMPWALALAAVAIAALLGRRTAA